MDSFRAGDIETLSVQAGNKCLTRLFWYPRRDPSTIAKGNGSGLPLRFGDGKLAAGVENRGIKLLLEVE